MAKGTREGRVVALLLVGAVVVAAIGVYLLIIGAIALVGWLYARAARRSREAAPPVRVALAAAGASTAAAPVQRYFPAAAVDSAAFEDARLLEESVRRVFGAWARQLPRAPAQPEGHLRSVALRRHLVGRLVTRLDGRRFSWRAAPYLGRASIPRTAPLDPRRLDPHAPPADLRRQSSYAEDCATCAGAGRCACFSCGGAAKVTCPGCGGAGKLYGLAKNGARRLLNCKTCKGKCVIACAACARGLVTCSGCSGAGRIERWLEVEGGPRNADVQVEPDGFITRAFAWGQDGVMAADEEISRDARVVCAIAQPRLLTLEELPQQVPEEWRRAHWAALQAKLAPGERVLEQRFTLLEVPSVEVGYAVGQSAQTIELEGLRLLAPPLSADLVFSRRAEALRTLAWGLAAVPAMVGILYLARGNYYATPPMLGVVACIALAAAVGYVVFAQTSLGRPALRWLGAAVVPLVGAAAFAVAAEPSEREARSLLEAGQLPRARVELEALQVPATHPLWQELHLKEVLSQPSCDKAARHLSELSPEAAQYLQARRHADALALAEAKQVVAERRFAALEPALACASEELRASKEAEELRQQAKRGVVQDCLRDARWSCAFDAVAELSDPEDREHVGTAAREQLRAWLAPALADREPGDDLSEVVRRRQEGVELWTRYLLPPEGERPAELRALEGKLAKEQRELEKQQLAEERRRQAAARRQQQEEERRRVAEERAERRRLAEERRRERASSYGAVQCCDGTLSPSCMCGGSLRGCCSHHGGVCGCN